MVSIGNYFFFFFFFFCRNIECFFERKVKMPDRIIINGCILHTCTRAVHHTRECATHITEKQNKNKSVRQNTILGGPTHHIGVGRENCARRGIAFVCILGVLACVHRRFEVDKRSSHSLHRHFFKCIRKDWCLVCGFNKIFT